MANKYHINENTGRVNICRATGKRGCPFGGESGVEDHFSSKEEALAQKEKIIKKRLNVEHNLTKLSKTSDYDPDKTPMDVDAKLENLYVKIYKNDNYRNYYVKNIHKLIGDKEHRFNGYKYSDDEALSLLKEKINSGDPRLGYVGERSISSLERIDSENSSLKTEAKKLEKVHRQHGWNRFFVVDRGHIHNNMNCSTCNKNNKMTKFGWLPDLSGKTEKEAVEQHGAKLCTVCFPSAPSEYTNYYELLEKKKEDNKCPGSNTVDYVEGTKKGKYGECSYCHEIVTQKSTYNIAMRTHNKK